MFSWVLKNISLIPYAHQWNIFQPSREILHVEEAMQCFIHYISTTKPFHFCCDMHNLSCNHSPEKKGGRSLDNFCHDIHLSWEERRTGEWSQKNLVHVPFFSPLADALLNASLMLGVILRKVAMVIRSAKESSMRSWKWTNQFMQLQFLFSKVILKHL